jgi:serine phosphatase RsbU (regulator of sigma subunit)
MTHQEIKALLAHWTNAHARQNVSDMMTVYADDCVVESPTYGTLIGHDAAKKSWESFFASFSDISCEYYDPLIFDDYAVVTLAMQGTDTGGFLGQAQTLNPVRTFVVFIFTIKSGKIMYERRVWDRGGFLLQLAGEGQTGESGPLYRSMLHKALLERDVALAAEIQQALLPPPRHHGNSYEVAAASIPCRAIGGDFVDYFDLPNGAFAIALGDVAGKGPPAALLAGMVQGIFASRAQLAVDPAETLTHVNQVLLRRAIEARFVTAVYSVLADGQLTYCNAGHNAPFVLGRGGLRRLDKGGSILGMFKDAAFEQETIQLSEGDLLVSFSDGVTEAVNNQGDDFGEGRLLDCLQSHWALAPSDLLKRLFDEVRQFCAGAPQSDDLTALVLRYL